MDEEVPMEVDYNYSYDAEEVVLADRLQSNSDSYNGLNNFTSSIAFSEHNATYLSNEMTSENVSHYTDSLNAPSPSLSNKSSQSSLPEGQEESLTDVTLEYLKEVEERLQEYKSLYQKTSQVRNIYHLKPGHF